jgi:hypothetical protein
MNNVAVYHLLRNDELDDPFPDLPPPPTPVVDGDSASSSNNDFDIDYNDFDIDLPAPLPPQFPMLPPIPDFLGNHGDLIRNIFPSVSTSPFGRFTSSFFLSLLPSKFLPFFLN